jgi:hypothetical protein
MFATKVIAPTIIKGQMRPVSPQMTYPIHCGRPNKASAGHPGIFSFLIQVAYHLKAQTEILF